MFQNCQIKPRNQNMVILLTLLIAALPIKFSQPISGKCIQFNIITLNLYTRFIMHAWKLCIGIKSGELMFDQRESFAMKK